MASKGSHHIPSPILLHDITLAPLTTAASVISLNVKLVVKILVGDKIIFQSNAASWLESKDLWMFKTKSEIPEECSIVAIHITDPSDDNVSVFHFKPVEVELAVIITKADKDRRFLHSMQFILLDDSKLSFQFKADFEIQETLDFPLNNHMMRDALVATLVDKKPISRHKLANIHDSVPYLPDSYGLRPYFMNLIGNVYLERYEMTWSVHDIDSAVNAHYHACQETLGDDNDEAVYVSDYGRSLLIRYMQHGDTADLNQSVLKHQEAVQLTPDGHPNKPSLLHNLGNSLLTRFEQLGDMTDLNQSVFKSQEAVQLTPDGHPNKPSLLNNLVSSLLTRFSQLGDMTDLNQSVLMVQEAVQLTPDGHPDKPLRLSNLGLSLLTRFEQFGDMADLNQSVLKYQEAVQLTPDDHPDKPLFLSNLGNSLLKRFWQLGDMTDLNQSVFKSQEAVQLTPDGHPDKPSWLSSLGDSLLAQFEQLGDMTDLNQSVLMLQGVVQLTHDGHPDKPSRLNKLGRSLLTRFERLGDVADLNQSVLKKQEAVQLTPDSNPIKSSWLDSLGNSLLTRFEQLGDMADLNQSVLMFQEALQLTLDGDLGKPCSLNNLGNSLLARFKRLGDMTDLNQSVLKHQEAVQLTPDGDPSKPSSLNNLGNSLFTRFEQLGDMTDLNQCVLKYQEAVQLTPDGHPDKPPRLSNLGDSLLTRFEQLGDMTDLNQSVLKSQEAVQLTPDGHPSKPAWLENLGSSLIKRFLKLRLSDDMVNAVWAYSSATCAEYGPPSVRLHAAKHWAMCLQASSSPPESILDIYHIAIPLLAETAWLGSSLPDRHYQIMQAGSVVHEAAAAAHQFGDHIQAVEWLEQGRSVIWSQLLQLRTPIDDLKEKEPNLCQRLQLNSMKLEEVASPKNFILNTTPVQASIQPSVISNEEIASHGHYLAIERKQILKEIRMCQGFERFLLPRGIRELTPAASHGPIVMLNSSEEHDTCYALVLLPNLPDDVLPVKLDSFTASQAKALYHKLKTLLGEDGQNISFWKGESVPEAVPDTRSQFDVYELEKIDAALRNLVFSNHNNIKYGADPRRKLSLASCNGTAGQGFKNILAELWEGVVRPVLEALELIDPSPKVKPPGLYHTDAPPGSKLSDFAISSYIPTVSALIDRGSPLSQPEPPKLLAIAQPSSIGLQRIPGTVDEIRYIKAAVEGSGALTLMTLIGEEATLSNVVPELKIATWVHFACHGVQNPAHPTESALLLAGKDRLTLGMLTSLKITHGGLAFLSACQTAKGDEKLSDEAVHLSAGMLAAGFGGVIATMWSVHDQVAPQVARDVYKYLLQSGMDVSEAAHALHSAVENARNKMEGDDDAAFISWVPYIHLGM
ncbi:hypothetical protein M422DRAFT_259081 [Sphaerobolus stellatus SS14]|uniref:CHAT domain-containing protein n=1 Tax=Sphaerobolus stellatus (strain SS14) TaxID=990650 RepID=A0A0C9UTH2_SPHS4|nr:hypothetical protein M422DRAFT_259081 [Sphaerobolus stellatus SS14]